MGKKNHTIESLIASGYISATFGARLAKDKEEGVITGAIVETAISATLLANQEAKKTNQPVLIAENEKRYRILPSGEKQFVKDLPRPIQKWKEHFKLK